MTLASVVLAGELVTYNRRPRLLDEEIADQKTEQEISSLTQAS